MSQPASPRSPESVICDAVDLVGRRIIDVGCGEGSLSRLLAERGASEVIGVECGAEMLAHARAGQAIEGLRFVEGVGEDLPLADGSADLVVFSNSLHHVPPDAQFAALQEAHRVLAPRGELLVLEPIAKGPSQAIMAPVHDETTVRAHAQAQLRHALERRLFRERTSFEFTKVVVHPSFEAFRERILRINPHRQPEVDAMGERWRELFEREGVASAKGWRFEQPIAFSHFERI